MHSLERPIVFLHIPKTGGQTFNFILKKICEEHNLKYLQKGYKGVLPRFSFEVSEINSSNVDIFSGHFVFNNDCKKVDVFTIVRDLHKTFLSNIYFQYFDTYIKRNLNKNNLNPIKEKINFKLDLTEKDILEIELLINNNFITSNSFTKTIAGIPYEKYFYTVKDEKINENDYNKALTNLSYFKSIGILEDFNNFIIKFINLYDFTLDSYTSQNTSNVNDKFINFMVKNLNKKIIQYNYYDFLLINEIKNIFI